MSLYLIIFVALLGIVAYELSGNLVTRYWKPYVKREENPARYWFNIIGQILGALVLAYLAIHHLLPTLQ
jgi:uncharacterized membrane protein